MVQVEELISKHDKGVQDAEIMFSVSKKALKELRYVVNVYGNIEQAPSHIANAYKKQREIRKKAGACLRKALRDRRFEKRLQRNDESIKVIVLREMRQNLYKEFKGKLGFSFYGIKYLDSVRLNILKEAINILKKEHEEWIPTLEARKDDGKIRYWDIYSNQSFLNYLSKLMKNVENELLKA